MKRIARLPLIRVLFILLALSGCATQQQYDEYVQETVDGLERVKTPKVDVAYVRPDAEFSNYKKVMITSVDVSFRKDWSREHREISQAEQGRIRLGLANLFREVFRDELEKKGGIPVVKQPGPDVLGVRAQLIDLDITAPDDLRGTNRTIYVTEAGSVTLVGELYDSVTGEILARVADHKIARTNTGQFQIADRVSNSMEARRALRYWASLLRERLTAIKTG